MLSKPTLDRRIPRAAMCWGVGKRGCCGPDQVKHILFAWDRSSWVNTHCSGLPSCSSGGQVKWQVINQNVRIDGKAKTVTV
jgi:hypothetical protein